MTGRSKPEAVVTGVVSKVLGLDPGSTSTGWSLLEVAGGRGAPLSARYLAAGDVTSSSEPFSVLLREHQPDVVAIEKLEGFAYASKGAGVVAGLVASSRAAGLIAAVAWASGVAVVEMTASEWRRMILGKHNATDKQIGIVIPRLIRGWPKRSNVHERDAAGVALGCGWRLAMSRNAFSRAHR